MEDVDTLIDTLWELRLDGSWEQTGDTAWSVWAAFIPVDAVLRERYPELTAGAYIVTQDDLGFKDAIPFDTEADGAVYFAELESEYGKWAEGSEF